MDPQFLSQVENSALKKRLLNSDNIPAIEDILDRESQSLEKLQALKAAGRLDFGKKVSSSQLNILFPAVALEVDAFLGLPGGELPNFGYYSLLKPGVLTTPVALMYAVSAFQFACAAFSIISPQSVSTPEVGAVQSGMFQFGLAAVLHFMFKGAGYFPPSKQIILERVARTDLIPSACHEYTHYIQNTQGAKGTLYCIFKEGQARGVERHLSEVYAEREDNQAFLYNTADASVGELQIAYVWMCRQLGLPAKQSLLKTRTAHYGGIRSGRLPSGEPSLHTIGNAFFSIYGAREGREIHKQMIHGEYKFT